METLNVGTKEVMVVGVADRISGISSLNGYNVEQRIISEDETVVKQDWATVLTTDGMDAHALIDTTGWSEGVYKLYVRVNISPEVPILGPWEFGVS